MKGRTLYIVLSVFIGLFFTVSLIGGDSDRMDVLMEEDAETVSAFEETLEAKLKTNFGSPEAVQALIDQHPGLVFSMASLAAFFAIAIPAGAVILLVYLIRKVSGREWIRRVQTPPQAAWPASDILRVAVLFVFMAYCISLLEGVFAGLGWVSEEGLTRTLPIVNTLILDVWIACLILMFVRLRQPVRSFEALGLVRRRMGSNIFVGGVSYLCILPVLLVVITAMVWIVQWIQYEPPTHPLLTTLVIEESRWMLLISIALGIGVGPWVEELFFRGFCYGALKRRLGVWPSIAVSSLVFSAVHQNPFGVLPIFCLGAALAYLYEKTGSLTGPIVVHAVHNGVLIIMLNLSKELVTLS